MQERAVWSHIITSHYGAPLMVARGKGLIIEITDGTGYDYRGARYYSLAKISASHLAAGMARDQREHGVTALALTPGYLRLEAMLDHFSVTEAPWRDAIKQDRHFAKSETPYNIGRAVACLAADRHIAAKAGKTFAIWGLFDEYGFTDVDGTQPNWGGSPD